MKINFEDVNWHYRRLIKKIYNKAEEYTNNTFKGVVVTVSFASEKRIKELNNNYRKVDNITDVLSFPMLDIVYPQHVKDYSKEVSPDGILYLGDVVICPKRAKEQASEYGHSKKREVAFLALHGLLHLYGYDHIKVEDEKIMKNASKEILEELKIRRKKNV